MKPKVISAVWFLETFHGRHGWLIASDPKNSFAAAKREYDEFVENGHNVRALRIVRFNRSLSLSV